MLHILIYRVTFSVCVYSVLNVLYYTVYCGVCFMYSLCQQCNLLLPQQSSCDVISQHSCEIPLTIPVYMYVLYLLYCGTSIFCIVDTIGTSVTVLIVEVSLIQGSFVQNYHNWD